jgi:Fe(3+) dicitrate transport protein
LERKQRVFSTHTHAFIGYRFTDKTKISAEYTNMNYDMQQPGGLTDAQFDENPRQSVQS